VLAEAHDVTTVSVLVASKDREALLPGCLRSLLAQTLIGETEILVIHGPGGKDAEAAAPFMSSGRIRLVASTRPGLYAAWNAGIGEATGRFVANLNSDDRLRPDALEVMARELDAHPEAALVYGDSLVTRRPDETFEESSSGGERLSFPDYSHEALLARCICGPHPMWRRGLHERIGLFDESFVFAGDYEFWMRIAEVAPMRHIPDALGLYYDNPDGLSRVAPGKTRERVRIVQRYLHCYRDVVRAKGGLPSRTPSS
jgi:glycosyltransferase involved in cell wall biosynthesis